MMPDRHPIKNLFTSCLWTFAIPFGFYLLTQIEIVLEAYWQRLDGLHAQTREALTLLFGYNENLLVAALCTAAFYASRKRRGLRWLCVLGISLALLFLVVNQVFYVQIDQHLQFSPGDLASFNGWRILDSLQSFMGPVFYLNLTLWLVATLLLYRQLIAEQTTSPGPRWWTALRSQRRWTGVSVITLIAAGLFLVDRDREYVHHPLFTLAASLTRNDHRPPDPAEYDPSLDLYTLRYDQPAFSAASEQPLLDYFSARQARGQPNIIYLILESVGSLNLFKDGQLDPAITPNLYQLRQHSVVFPAVYTVFPSSKRSHLAINTGGLTYTWSGEEIEGDFYYGGPTLARRMNELGYAAGLFSATFMDAENFLDVYRHEPFDAFVIPDYQNEDTIRLHLVNSWGIDEMEVLRRMTAWVDTLPADQPFFAMFLTSSTHHPYNVPQGYVGPFAGDDDLTLYHNALYFTDEVIGRLVANLEARGLAETTVLAIMGDHGEAFGDRHATNRFHRDYLYEENIRDFLMLVDLGLEGGPLTSLKRASVGDLMPTLTALAGQIAAPEPDRAGFAVLGQNLFAPEYQERIHYFHKNSAPEKWGLIDGRWKFIAHRLDEMEPELYDLESDPTEQNKLAALFPDRVQFYDRLVATWYIRMDRAFLERLSTPQVGRK
jgi:arylsulfatase A-like enzyme